MKEVARDNKKGAVDDDVGIAKIFYFEQFERGHQSDQRDAGLLAEDMAVGIQHGSKGGAYDQCLHQLAGIVCAIFYDKKLPQAEASDEQKNACRHAAVQW